jgi:ABC-type multidrug transport system ATPase subunit
VASVPISAGSTSPPPDRGIIRLTGLHKHYSRGRVHAVDGISFEVHQGRVYGLIGPDGAGKTSILQILAGVLSADSGAASIAGIDVRSRPEDVKPLIGYMPQGLGLNLYDSLSVAENIEFFRALRQVPEATFRENRERLLAMTRLAPFLDRPVAKLSGGMRQKLALICTLIHLPDILLLDEPTTGVDPISRRDFWTIIQDLVASRGATVLLTTAYMDEAERCNYVALMHQGRIIASGAPDALAESLTVRLLAVGGAPPLVLQRIFHSWPETESVALFGAKVHLALRDPAVDVAARLRQAGITGALVGDIPAGLEDIFVHHLLEQRAPTSGDDTALGALSRDPPPETAVPIATEGLTCRFGDFVAVDAVDLEVRTGEIFGLLGPNGAGKTTLIKMLCGLLAPSAGRARVTGHDLGLADDRLAVRAHIGYMSQRFSLYRNLTVTANMELYAGLYGLPRKTRAARIATLLAGLGLAAYADRATKALPLGLRQRLALASALLHEPSLLFLDEPTSGVDPVARRQFWDMVHLLARENGITVLVSTHFMDEAEHCDRLALMHQGRLAAAGTPAELKTRAEAEAGPAVFVQARDFARAYQLLRAQFPHAMLYGRRIQWQSRQPEQAATMARNLLATANIVAHVGRQALTMEEAFVHFVEQAEARHA